MNQAETSQQRGIWVAVIIASILIVDQITKIWVKTHFYLGEDVEVFPWFHIKFIENNGMAFGMELTKKLFLTLGRIVAVTFFVWLIIRIKDERSLRGGFMVALALITAGAAGNIIDCVFYGQLFNNPYPPEVAVMFPPHGGYAGWFEGQVVDMLYFPMFSFYWPDWIPVVGGDKFEFFQYIFNIADSAICIGVGLLIFIYANDVNKVFNLLKNKDTDTDAEA